MHPFKILSVLTLSLGLAFSSGVHAEEDDEDTGDWLCDRLGNLVPPPGCAVIEGEHPMGICVSLASSDPWNCLGSWTPVIEPKSALINHGARLPPGLALPQPQGFALQAPGDLARRARLVIDSNAVLAAPSGRLPLFELGQGEQGLRLSAERTTEGSTELVLRKAEGKAQPALARLPLSQGRSTTLVEWRVHPQLGPQLILEGSRSQLQHRLPALDAHTRLQTWRIGGASLHFDLRPSSLD
jgi:hypothetical protein